MKFEFRISFLVLMVVAGSSVLLANDKRMDSFSSIKPALTGSLGADFTGLSKAEATRLGVAGGVVVTRIYAGGALSNQTKMRTGFVITAIGDIPVASVSGLKYALGKQKSHFQIQGFYPGSKQVEYYSIRDF